MGSLIFFTWLLLIPVAWIFATRFVAKDFQNDYGPNRSLDAADAIMSLAVGFTIALFWPVVVVGFIFWKVVKRTVFRGFEIK